MSMSLERSWFSTLSPVSELGCAPRTRQGRAEGTRRAQSFLPQPRLPAPALNLCLNVTLTLKTGRQSK